MLNVKQAALARRSVRNFTQQAIDKALLEDMVDAARLGPSGANLQPLDYVVTHEPESRAAVYAGLKWALYTAPKGTPAPGHEPTAYITILSDKNRRLAAGAKLDVGAAAAAICLTAQSFGLASCWHGAFDRAKGAAAIGLPENMEMEAIIALGYPDESPVVVEIEGEPDGDNIKYWRDDKGVNIVPKRPLASVIHWDKF